jgi:hypothetical protein
MVLTVSFVLFLVTGFVATIISAMRKRHHFSAMRSIVTRDAQALSPT